MTIRVVYHFDVDPTQREDFVRAWHLIVQAHGDHGALESMLLESQDEAGRWVAISRWVDRQTWQTHRTDDAHPEAYAIFRRCATVVDKAVYDEVAHLTGA